VGNWRGMISLSFIQIASMVATVVIVLGVGIYVARSVTTAEGFSVAGRSSGPVLIAGSILGTCIGGSATVGTAQLAATIGLSAWWFTTGIGIALVIMALLYARPLRRTGLETIPQYLAIHFGPHAGPITTIISSIGTLLSVVAPALAGIHTIAMIFGVPPWAAARIVVALVSAYVEFGGMKGASVSGVLRTVLIAAVLGIAGIAAALSLARTPELNTVLPAFPYFSMWGQGAGSAFGNLASLIIGMLCTQIYIQAIYSATDTRQAVVGTTAAALIAIPVGLPSVAIGMFMHVHHPEIAPVLALPMYFSLYLPPWLGGIGLAGILLSVIGSIAGLSLGIGTMIANDIGRGLLHVTANRTVLLINRLSVLAVTCAAMLIGLSSLDSYLLDWNYMSFAVRGGGVFLPFTLAIFWPGRVTAFWAILSMIAGTAAGILAQFFALPFNPQFVGLIVSAALILLGIVLSVVPGRSAAALTIDASGRAP
jgi:solute:Na+ symporter, SSS family